MLTEQLLSFLLLIPVTLGQSQVQLEMLKEEIFIHGASCNCTEEISKTKQQVKKKIEDLENQNKNLQDQFNNLQLKLDRLQQRSEGHEACFEDLGSDNCKGSKSGLIGIVEAIRVDGGWGPFSDWSRCSAPCGGGVQVRNRTCDNPAPENGGKPCTGNGEEQRRCNADQCFDGCYEEDTDYHGNDLNLGTGRNKDRRVSASECQKLCAQTKMCKFFTWKKSSKECWSKTKGGPGNSRQEKGSVSGPRVCGGRAASDQGSFNFPAQRGSRAGDPFGRIG